jgi:hypothetical protein
MISMVAQLSGNVSSMGTFPTLSYQQLGKLNCNISLPFMMGYSFIDTPSSLRKIKSRKGGWRKWSEQKTKQFKARKERKLIEKIS